MELLIMQDRHVTHREIGAFLDIWMTSIHKILLEHLGVKRICLRCISHNKSLVYWITDIARSSCDLREIEAFLYIWMTSMHKILLDHLAVKRICSCCVSHNLAIVQKKYLTIGVKKCLYSTILVSQMLRVNKIHTGGLIWIYSYQLASKHKSTAYVFYW